MFCICLLHVENVLDSLPHDSICMFCKSSSVILVMLLALWCMVMEVVGLLYALGEKEHHSKSDLGASEVGDLASL